MPRKLSRKKVIEQFRAIHGNKYSYKKFVYKGNSVKGIITCFEHGDFKQTPNHHKRGQGCPKCGVKKKAENLKLTIKEVIKRFRNVHGNKYDYSNVNYVNSSTKIKILCPEHGVFEQIPYNHLRGNGCPKCAGKQNLTYDDVIEQCKKTHYNKYSYPEKNRKIYKNIDSKIYIECPVHGEFLQTIDNHKNMKQGCPKCAGNIKISYNTLIKELKQIHNNKYSYPEKNRKIYKNAHSKIYIICPKHGEFIQKVNNHKNGQGCPKCPITISKLEQELANYIMSLGHKIIQSHRGWCPERPQLEIDIFIPELNLGFEFNGNYWHSKLPKDYHKEKTILALNNNIKLIHIWEKKWVNKKESVKRMIKERLL